MKLTETQCSEHIADHYRKYIEKVDTIPGIKSCDVTMLPDETLHDLIQMGYVIGQLPNALPYPTIKPVLKLVRSAPVICREIEKALSGDKETRYRNEIFFVWCAYGGIGTTILWYDDPKKYMRYGLARYMIEQRGINELDEYVLSLMGIEYNSEEYAAFSAGLMLLAKSLEPVYSKGTYQSTFKIADCAEAMFLYGMTYQLHRLGLIPRSLKYWRYYYRRVKVKRVLDCFAK